ncbi:MAG TPA: MATE family efflux transporter, partial [Steroidobacter sp.]|nr:MATE family efflux transporter [Steroidobacter sp.]
MIRQFGAAAQAGFGIGGRVMHGILLPAMAIAFAVAPVAGQNFGARRGERVRETFRSALTMGVGVMLLLRLLCQWRPDVLIRFFSREPEVVEMGAMFLRLISWNFAASGVFTCSGVFQALGNTMPSLFSSATRLAYVGPAIWLS